MSSVQVARSDSNVLFDSSSYVDPALLARNYTDKASASRLQYDRDECFGIATELFLQADQPEDALRSAAQIVNQIQKAEPYSSVGKYYLQKGEKRAAFDAALRIDLQEVRDGEVFLIAIQNPEPDIPLATAIASKIESALTKDLALRHISDVSMPRQGLSTFGMV